MKAQAGSTGRGAGSTYRQIKEGGSAAKKTTAKYKLRKQSTSDTRGAKKKSR